LERTPAAVTPGPTASPIPLPRPWPGTMPGAWHPT